MANPDIHAVCIGVLGLTAVSTVGIVIVLLPGVLESRWVTALTRVRRIGPEIGHLVEAMQMYRRNGRVLVLELGHQRDPPTAALRYRFILWPGG